MTAAPKFTLPNGYRLDPCGAVYSLTGWRGRKERELSPAVDDDGYEYYRVTINGKREKRYTHRLMAHAFLGPRPSEAHEVRHLDGNPRNNRVSNLAWGTRQENADDRRDHGRNRNGFIAGTVDREAHRAACRRAKA